MKLFSCKDENFTAIATFCILLKNVLNLSGEICTKKRVCPETVVQYIFRRMSFLQECFTQNIPISFLLMFELFVVVIVFQQKYN